MSKLQVGDRVRVYCLNLAEQAVSFKGQVTGFFHDGSLQVEGDEYRALRPSKVHPKQCRKLRPKAPRQRVYIPTREAAYPVKFASAAEFFDWLKIDSIASVEFIEVRRKK